MSVYDAIQLNDEMIDLLQTRCEEQAIQLCVAQWATLNVPLPLDMSDTTTHVIPPTPLGSPFASRSPSPSLSDDSVCHVDISATLSASASAAATSVLTVQSVLTDDFMSAFPWREWESGNMFTLYHRAFVVRTSTEVMPYFVWLRCVRTVRMVLYYHLGLAHHLQAVKRNSLESLAIALRCYQVAHGILLTLLLLGHQDPELDILVMALYNNMGHCYGSLDASDTSAIMCFVAFCETLVRSNCQDDLEADELLFFYDRLVLGVSLLSRPASAA